MYIARILYPVQVLGPGKRVGIWFVGCKHKCKGCSNPELWNINKISYVTIEQAEKLIRNVAKENVIDGFTITGGDPMEQADEIADLLERIRDISEDVLLYTGYEIAELTSDMHIKLLDKVAVLIDGRYEEDLNDSSFLRGSSNQIIHILKKQYRDKYHNYINNNQNEIQNFMINNEVVSVGIHKKDFRF
ncbi:MAG: 4Fe-4S single cluster domain-containing protein [Blautia sp.]|nr:4Fe-4S single cluster domain-containing protein [Blautia sp.]